MDRIWHHYGLDNRQPLSKQAVSEFYSHSVWLMNGVFTQLDPVSHGHRTSIARYLKHRGVGTIADYGGGFGALASAIKDTIPIVDVVIVEPYPCQAAIERFKEESRIRFVDNLSNGCYEAVIAQDVLEHVEFPIQLAYQIADAVRPGGIAIFANCFYPVIQCHLPATFHLRHTFRWVMERMGLRYIGVVEGAAHAQIFERNGRLDMNKASSAERLSRVGGTIINGTRAALSYIKRSVVRQ